MPRHTWFLFDIGNVVIKLAYERVLSRVCAASNTSRDELIALMERDGGYRDLERGVMTFLEFYEGLKERAGYRGSLAQFRDIWLDFFDGPVEGIEALIDEIRERYRVAFLSNSNEVHAEHIPRHFPTLFRKEDRIIFSHVHQCAKPDPQMYERALQILGALPGQVIFTDDLVDNVIGAQNAGMTAYHFQSAMQLRSELKRDGLLT